MPESATFDWLSGARIEKVQGLRRLPHLVDGMMVAVRSTADIEEV